MLVSRGQVGVIDLDLTEVRGLGYLDDQGDLTGSEVVMLGLDLKGIRGLGTEERT